MHMDCCAEQRGCAICAAQLERAKVHGGYDVEQPLTGELLRGALDGLPPAAVTHVPNDDPTDPYDLRTAVVEVL